ncbi:MAG: hypothetical protein VB084_05560 [Syntrophomonadaceae bacterium]|nr:hypothetical protein [Syntrophomonadaceae bacterium]
MTGSKKSFPLRIDPKIYAALEKWSQDELRSVNAHIEFLLREALKRANRLPLPDREAEKSNEFDIQA